MYELRMSFAQNGGACRAMKSKSLIYAGAAALGALALTAPAAHALEFFFLPSGTFSGTAPAGTLTAAFTNVAQSSCTTANGGVATSGGCVQLAITSNLASGENLDPGKALYLNIDPAKSSELGSLTFDLTANTGFSQAAAVGQSEDGFKADGIGGNFDMLFTYSPATKAFTTGQSQTYDIFTTSGTIATADFDFLSTGGTPDLYAAIHVQNTPSGGNGSAFVGGVVPAPLIGHGLLVLLAIGGVLFGGKLLENLKKRHLQAV
jgi:hypothetical protein